MTTRYQKRHYEDVAEILLGQISSVPPLNWIGRIAEVETNATVKRIAYRFVGLFAADNPPICSLPDEHTGDCEYTGGKATTGFDREQFLVACGLGAGDDGPVGYVIEPEPELCPKCGAGVSDCATDPCGLESEG